MQNGGPGDFDGNSISAIHYRQNGELISAEPFVNVNWAKGINKSTGRPDEDPSKRPRLGQWARNICPNLFGGKNWEPMSYSLQTGLVYIPSFNLCMDIAGKRILKMDGKGAVGVFRVVGGRTEGTIEVAKGYVIWIGELYARPCHPFGK